MTVTAKRCPSEDAHAALQRGERCKTCNHPSNPDMFDALGLSPPEPEKERGGRDG